jgi:hypothetical protein
LGGGVGGTPPLLIFRQDLSAGLSSNLVEFFFIAMMTLPENHFGSIKPWFYFAGISIPTCRNCFAVSCIFNQTLRENFSADPD